VHRTCPGFQNTTVSFPTLKHCEVAKMTGFSDFLEILEDLPKPSNAVTTG
jgi:hypothetical protein